MPLNRARARDLLAQFDFQRLFIEEAGWNSAPQTPAMPIGDTGYMRRLIAEMSGVAILEITPSAPSGELPDAKTCDAIHRQIEQVAHEHALIFVDDDRQRAKSMLSWVKREEGKRRPRRHYYYRGQPGDNFMSKIDGMVIEMDELREDGSLPISEMTARLASALDIERVTKKFYSEFKSLRMEFIALIEGIADEAERNWYGSVLLNRLMFIYFLQKKGFIQNKLRYLDDKLKESQARGRDRYYSEFLVALFFEGFAKPAHKRSETAQDLLGSIPYLNGGLFIRQRLELENANIRIPDRAFENALSLFRAYDWYLDDAPGARDNEIHPDVLGYIFEKYINQKAFGAYYTRGEITEYLCERGIDSLILQRVMESSGREFSTIDQMRGKLDADLCRRLLFDILPKLSILDPACGSGAFLVAAMKNLLNTYAAIYGSIEFSNDPALSAHLKSIRQAHPSLNYYIRKQIIINNLYGVDIMEEAAEIARLRLYLALVSAAQHLDELEPLPNIDFNIMAGNSLIGLLNVDATRYDRVRDMAEQSQQDFLQPVNAQKYRRALAEKNRLIQLYRGHAEVFGPPPPGPLPQNEGGGIVGEGDSPSAISGTADSNSPSTISGTADSDSPSLFMGARGRGMGAGLQALRERINQERQAAQGILNDILLDDFQAMKIQYEQAQIKGRPIKRPLEKPDIAALKPFHWGYEFDEIIEVRGGFDVIITNPPWEVFKPQDEEFFAEYDDSLRQKRANRVEKRRIKARLLEDGDIRRKYLDYQSGYRYVSAFYRSTAQYINQISRVNGRKQGTDINLYKLFTEQCFNLLREGGTCGIVIPSGIYSDLGTKQLRSMLFEQTQLTGLFGFQNRKRIFEDVVSLMKFVVMDFRKGGKTISFPAAFMRHDVEELADFPNEESMRINVDLITRSSPSSLSVTEFKTELDIQITEKMLRFPLLGEELSDAWNVKLNREFDMTNDSDLFHDEPGEGRLPLYEGKMIWQFQHGYAAPRYWIDEAAGRRRVLGKRSVDNGQRLGYQEYRLAFRDIARGTDTRSFISTIIPKRSFAGNKIPTVVVVDDGVCVLDNETQVFACAVWNSFVLDYAVRQKVSATLNFFYLYQLPVPRLKPGHRFFAPIVQRAAKLICTAPEYDDLATEVGLGGHHNGVTDRAERAKLRAELDGMIAHVYGLSESEFAHVLASFPLVAEDVKAAALEAYREI